MVSGSIFLFIGGVVLFVHHHHPQAGEWGKDGGPDPHHDVGFPRPDAKPLIEPLARRQRTVKQGDPVPEAGPESFRSPGGEGDLRDEDQRLPSLFDHPVNRLQVYLGFAAAGHPEEEERHVALCGSRSLDLGKGLPLGSGEGKGVGWGDRNIPEGVAADRGEEGLDEPLLGEGKDDRRGLGDGLRFLSREGSAHPEQVGEEVCLAWRPRPERGDGGFHLVLRTKETEGSLLSGPDAGRREDRLHQKKSPGPKPVEDGGRDLAEWSREATGGDRGIWGEEAEEFEFLSCQALGSVRHGLASLRGETHEAPGGGVNAWGQSSLDDLSPGGAVIVGDATGEL